MEILVFESSKQIADRIVDLISETEKEITFYKANSYAEALYFLNEYKPDAVLIDLKFPQDNSFELIKKIKESENKAMIIVLLNEVDDSTVEQCKEHGADFIFDKYVDFEQIPSVISAIR